MPWLHLVFDAWEDYKRLREREAAEQMALEATVHEAAGGDDEAIEEDGRKEKKKKKHRHKDKK
jgi:hypothetical protein